MGKTKIKVVDLSQPEEKKTKPAKSGKSKVIGAVEHTRELNDSDQLGAKQTHSEPTGRASSTLLPDEQVKNEAPRANARGIFSLASAERNLAEAENSHSSTVSQPWFSAKADEAGDKKPGKPSKKYRSKKYKKSAEQIDPNQRYKLAEAIELARKTSYSKFGGSIEAHINTAVKNIRGSVSLPHLSGKKITILAFPPSSKTSKGQAAEMEKDGIIIGNDETISEIEKGKVNFGIIITTPEWMPKLAKVAKILGPRGLMPSPKNDTVTENLAKAISERRTGKTEYKTENDGQVIHLAVGAISQNPEEIADNIKVLYNTIGKSKIKKITLAPTMGPGIKVDPSSI